MSRRKKIGFQKTVLRVTAAILACLMAAAALFTLIGFIIDASATDGELDKYAFSCKKTDGANDEFYVAVGLRYGSAVKASHAVSSPYGFIAGEVYIDSDSRQFTPFLTIDESALVIAADANLVYKSGTLEIAASEKSTDIGAYHVQLSLDGTAAWARIDELSTLFFAEYGHVFPAQISGERVVRVGAFASYSDASAAAAKIGSSIEGFTVSVASPSADGICVINEDCDTILFEYTAGGNYSGAVCPLQSGNADDGRAYIYYAPTTHLYDGVFAFRRYSDADVAGLTLINLVSMQRYVEGVLPSEISSAWPLETQKAFAVTVRAYTVSNLGSYITAYGFDLKNTASSQVYRGRYSVNSTVERAVAETKNLALSYGTTLVSGYYSSSQGGYSVGTKYVWGGTTGSYLATQATPWENYSAVSRGFWNFEMTEKELLTAFGIYDYGDTVADVSYEFAGESTYIYSMTVTDSTGESATITRTSKIKAAFDDYGALSANLMIGKGSLDYVYDKVISTRVVDLSASYTGKVDVQTSGGVTSVDAGSLSYYTADGVFTKDESGSLYVQTANGTVILTSADDISVSTKPDENGYYTYVSNYGTFLIITELQQIKQTYVAANASNYVIVGRGNGHGVGASQYGMYHLANAGATYDQILAAYYPGTEITNFFEYWNKR